MLSGCNKCTFIIMLPYAELNISIYLFETLNTRLKEKEKQYIPYFYCINTKYFIFFCSAVKYCNTCMYFENYREINNLKHCNHLPFDIWSLLVHAMFMA